VKKSSKYELSESEIREIVRKILSEDYFSSATADAPSYAYSIGDKEEKNYDYQPEETIQSKAKRLGLPYSPIINKFEDEDLEILSQIVKKFKNTGDIELNYKSGWQGKPLMMYLIEFLGIEAKNGNQKAALKLEKIFDGTKSKDIRSNLVRNYNKTGKANKLGTLIQDENSDIVMKAIANMNKLRWTLKLLEKYHNKGKNDHLLPFLLHWLQMRFRTEYEAFLAGRTTEPKKPNPNRKNKYRDTYSISDIQKYLYAGNTPEERNDNFMKFNAANKEIVDTLKSKKVNPKHLAIIDGMINSRLDTEEMVDVYPKLFTDITTVARNFSQAVKSKLGDYMDQVYVKHGLELPPIKQWKSREISPSQDPTKKLKDDKMGHIFEIREIIRQILTEI